MFRAQQKPMKTLSFKIKFALSLLTLVITSTSSAQNSVAQLFSSYVQQYSTPEVFENNTVSLDARLKLLDMAQAGANAKIATFVFDNGRATRRLARHVCLAQKRGVQVELIVDSKSGDQVRVENPFDNTDDAKVQEELYQYMTNCGARVFIHNSLASYIEVFGKRIPNIFLDPAMDGKVYTAFSIIGFGNNNILAVQSRLNAIIDRASQLINAELARSGVNSDVKPLLLNMKNFAMEYMNLMSLTKAPQTGDGGNTDPYENSINLLTSYYQSFLHDPIWSKMSAEKIKQTLPRIVEAFKKDPEMSRLHAAFHRFNRLNHRKLFLVQSADGQDACMLLGGRNLGDHYLQNTSLSYLDGDVMLCRNQGGEQSSAIDQAIASFEELKNEKSDAVLGLANDNIVRLINKTNGFTYNYLAIPQALMPAGSQNGTYSGSLPVAYRQLLSEQKWSDSKAIHGDLQIKNSSGWKLLTSSWDSTKDQISDQLIKLIDNESKEIYLETAYGEFNQRLRTSIENALNRGVKVNLVTNSLFISDGLSRVIRILMANWLYKTKAAHEKEFQIAFTTSAAGHMIHFKGAGFACQKNGDVSHRSYLTGSHNFHPRSGRDDKEHALVWNEPAANSCQTGFDGLDDLVNARLRLYKQMTVSAGTDVLEYYPDFFSELSTVSIGHEVQHDENAGQSALVARAMRRIFYREDSSGAELYEEARVRALLNLFDASGLHDMLGLVL